MAEGVKFGEFSLDAPNGQLWRGNDEIRLSHKAIAVLDYLVQRPGQLVSRDELFAAVWPQVIVSDGTLGECIREVRKGLGDSARTPRYVETVHRRGYRFIGQPRGDTDGAQESAVAVAETRPGIVVGRDADLAQLTAYGDVSLSGTRQLVFVMGEPGIGKSTLIDVYVERLRAQGACWIGHGQCIDQYGAGEAYLPILEAVGRLCREAAGAACIALLRNYAPTWLVQMPGLLSAGELESLQRQTAGATQRRMLREMAEALEAMSAETPVGLVFEDLHWSDHPTVEFLATLARRKESARLLVLCTYSPVEVLTREHPLKTMHQELRLHGQCAELAVDFLDEAAVAQYLTHRLAGAALPENLAGHIHRHTDGNPMFVVNVTDALLQQGTLTRHGGEWILRRESLGVPDGLRESIVQQFKRLGAEEQRCVEAASVAGVQFSAAAVAAGIEGSVEEVEALCEGLAEQLRFLEKRGIAEWADGTVAGSYGFSHSLYREVFYQRLPPGRLTALHLRIANCLEAAYGELAGDIAPELAVHFEQARDPGRALRYLATAAHAARLRGACDEAIRLARQGLALLPAINDPAQRTEQELRLQLELGTALAVARGSAAPDVETVFERAVALSSEVGDPRLRYGALAGLHWFHFLRAELSQARILADELLLLGELTQDASAVSAAQFASGNTAFYLGDLRRARVDLDKAIAVEWAAPPDGNLADPTVRALCISGLCLNMLGFPDQALQRVERAVARARSHSHPFSLVFSMSWAAIVHQRRREPRAALAWAEEGIELCSQYEGMSVLVGGLEDLAWCRAGDGGRSGGRNRGHATRVARSTRQLPSIRAAPNHGGIRWRPPRGGQDSGSAEFRQRRSEHRRARRAESYGSAAQGARRSLPAGGGCGQSPSSGSLLPMCR